MLKNKRLSPFSVEFWISKGFCKDDAILKVNSMRPVYKEYWMLKGFSEEESIQKALLSHKNNSSKGANVVANKPKQFHKNKSPRCKEYWMLKGFSEEDSIQKVKTYQYNFNLEKCIEKHGIENGTKIYNDRQTNWLKKS
jgi:hypothetical protein